MLRERAAKPAAIRLAVGGLLIAAGILLPQVFHLAGGRAMGEVFLPMHLPVLLAGFCLGPLFGGAVGILTPLASCLVTGMAMPAPAILPFMVVEMAVYGAAAGLFYSRFRIPALPALLLAQLAGRGLKSLVLLLAGQVFGLPVPAALTVFTSLAVGLPGLIIQWAAVPLILLALKKAKFID